MSTYENIHQCFVIPTCVIFKSPFLFSLPLIAVTILPSKNNIFEVSLSIFLFSVIFCVFTVLI